MDLPRTTRIHQSHSNHHDAKTYTLDTRPAHKDYRLMYSKRIPNPATAKTFPYRRLDDEDEDDRPGVSLDDVDFAHIGMMLDLLDA